MQGGAPVRVQVVASLTNLGVDHQYLKINTTSFQSDRTICINDKTAVDNNFSVNRKPQKAEYSLNHPSQSNILCMRAPNPSGVGSLVQQRETQLPLKEIKDIIKFIAKKVFNLDTKAKLKNIESNEQIIFMTWVNNNILALVTPTKVYHSDLTNQVPFVQVFERAGDLANPNCQIIGYKVSSLGNWGALYGISSPDQKQINGDIQLYKIDENIQQPLKGHCCCFGQAKVHNDTHLSDIFAYYERKAGETTAKIILRELSNPPEGFQKYKGSAEYPFNPQFPADFPIYMQVSTKYGQLFCLSKSGFVSVYELTSSALIFQNRVTDSSVFIGTQDSKEDGIYAIAKNGNVILVQIDPSQLIAHLSRQQQIPNVAQLAFKLASRYRLPGAEGMFLDQFNKFMMAGDYANAAQIAANAPGESIRNIQTIAKFKSLQGNPPPLMIYFQNLIQKGSLNLSESMELTQLLLSQNKKNAVDKLMSENKLECSEPLGDLVISVDPNMALEIYKKANIALKVVSTLGSLGRVDEANQYAQSKGINMDYMSMIRSTVLQNPQQAVQLAKTMVATNPSTNVHQVAEIFIQAGKFKEMSAFLVDCMKQNRPEDSLLQTKVLEWNIINEPNIVDAIFDLTKWNQYNRLQVATLCERKQLFQRALENYTDIKDIRRICLNVQVIPGPWLVNYLGQIQSEWALACMQDLLRHNRQNLTLVVEVAVKNHQKLTIPNIIKCFESVN